MQHEEIESDSSKPAEHTQRFLVFGLGGEQYASPLTMVKEVLRKGEVKEVPYMKHYFKGVINLRGQIISVIDLRTKFSLKPEEGSPELILVVENEDDRIAAIVDDVYSVSIIDENMIDRAPMLPTQIPANFFLGVARLGEKLVNLIDIGGSLTSEDFSIIKRAVEVA